MGGSDRPQQKTVRKELLLKQYVARQKSEYFIETGFKPVSMKINNMMYEKQRKVIPQKVRGMTFPAYIYESSALSKGQT